MSTVKKLNETTYEVQVTKSGEEFKHFKEHIFKLVPLNDSDSEIVSEELKDEEIELEDIANEIITNSTVSDEEDSLPF